MRIQFRCPECQKRLRVDGSAVGKRARCPGCSTVVRVPEPTSGGVDETTIAPLDAGDEYSVKEQPVAAPRVPPRAPVPHNPYAPPASSAFPSEYGPPVSVGGIRPTPLDLGGVFSLAWAILQQHMGICFGVVLFCFLLIQLFSFIGNFAIGVVQAVGAPEELIVLLHVSFGIVHIVFQVWISVGKAMFFVQTARGQQPPFSIIFVGGPRVLSVILYWILMGLIYLGPLAAAGIASGAAYLISQDGAATGLAAVVFLGMAFLCASLITYMSYPVFYLIVDREMGAVEAFQNWGEVMHGSKLSYLGLCFLAAMIYSLGCTLCVTAIVTVPFWHMLHAVAYLAMTGQPIDDESVGTWE